MDQVDKIAKAIGLLVSRSSVESIEQICTELESLPADADLSSANSIVRRIQNADARASLSYILKLVSTQESWTNPHALSLSLKSASYVFGTQNRRNQLELVWSGPTKSAPTFRRTDQALTDVIAEAKEELLIVSFAVVKVSHVLSALRQAIERGVHVTLIVETNKDSGGKLSHDGLREIRESGVGADRVFVWPQSARRKNAKGDPGVLHAKCAVADSKVAFISSANLTEAAMQLNMELGIIVRDSEVPSTIVEHFRSLISGGVICPVEA